MSALNSPVQPVQSAGILLSGGDDSPREADQNAVVGKATGSIRPVFDSFVCLALAVIVFRAFILEGYIISTGSMAPALLGFHKRVQCPDCGFRFARGVAFDDGQEYTGARASCPNCGQSSINIAEIPRASGDQLLVFKEAFFFRDPRRWETTVFYNPGEPLQAYVKRVIGRPGESVQIRDGDVFIDGRRARKPYAIQKSIRIPVFDNSLHPTLSEWIPRWLTDNGWTSRDGSFIHDSGEAAVPPPSGLRSTGDFDSWSWVRYYQWPRERLQSENETVAGSSGTRPDPVTDQYGYNDPARPKSANRVQDLMLDVNLRFRRDAAQFAVVIRHRGRYAVCRLDMNTPRVDVWSVDTGVDDARSILNQDQERKPSASALLDSESMKRNVRFEVSTFDSQLIVAVDERAVLAIDLEQAGETERSAAGSQSDPQMVVAGHLSSLTVDEAAQLTGDQESVVSFGAAGGSVEVDDVRLFRDVYYTSGDHRHGVDRPVRLSDDEFFFLGDNSPVSLDSRAWKNPAVPRHLIIGRPLVVHLPSKPAKLRIGDRDRYIRVPDFSRMRYIR